jgi:SAM-dependent methyltransferase
MDIARWLEFTLWYLRHPPWDTGISPPELFAFMREHAPGRALDLGCGTGTNVITLAQHGWQVTGVDFAPPAIAVARRKARAAGVKADLRVGDVMRLNGVAGPFDLILDIGCFHGLPAEGRLAYRDNVLRLLAPGGCLRLYVHLREEASPSTHGLREHDLDIFSPGLQLTQREDGMDGRRRSAWMQYGRRGAR